MKITLPIANRQTLTFDGFDKLAAHFGTLADAYRKTDRGRAEAYDAITWQLYPSNGFRVQLDVPQGWEVCPQPGDPNLWSAYKDGEFRAGMFGTEQAAREWIEKYTKAVDRILKIKYCAAGGVSDEYMAGSTTIREDQLVAWIYDQIRSGSPLLIVDMDDVS